MKNNLHLNLLYNFVELPFGAEVKSHYKIVHFFSEVGPVSKKTMDDIYNRHTQNFDEMNYYFNSLDELGDFAIKVCVELSAPEIFILSAQDYNIGLDSCNDVRSFREIFRRYGTCITNPESGSKKKNLFNKFFD